jgi:ribonucleoside-diphosphate reductase beta chain
MILDPGFDLTLRPMKYPVFYDMYRASIRNTWTVEEVNLGTDVADLNRKMSSKELHLIQRLVAFFATGDTIVANNLVLSLYKHINSPEARMYLSRQLAEEALHIQFYLTLLDTYIPDPEERNKAFAAVHNIPSIKAKADFCFKWIDSMQNMPPLSTRELRGRFIRNLTAFAACIEGLFFFAAFAYVYFLRSKGLLHGLATGTNYIFKEESAHMDFAFEVLKVAKQEEPDLFDAEYERDVRSMLEEAIRCEEMFAEDLLGAGIAGMSMTDMKEYLRYIADQRLANLGFGPSFGARNPFPFMALQNVQEHTNFFERRPTAYQVGVTGSVRFDATF